MKISKSFYHIRILTIATLIWGQYGCVNDPQYPLEPKIEFRSISFRPADRGSGESEQIILWLNFQDGNGDLGLQSSDTNAPFNPYNCTIVTSRCDTFITYLRKIGTPNNLNYYNFFVEFLIKDSTGAYKNCNQLPDCDINSRFNNMLENYNGRFKDLNDRTRPKPISGQLNYNLSSTQFTTAFRGRTLKLSVSIQDRALNRSNTVVTDSLVF